MTAAHQTDNAPQLVVIAPSRLRGTAYVLSGGRVVVGRGVGCELHLDDATVSRTHAALERCGSETLVTDLGSANGTTINRDPVDATGRRLRSGDIVRFGAVELRFQLPQGDAEPPTGTVPRTVPHNVEYRVQSQSAGELNNVAHDQYNAYIQQVREERDSFARDIASTKTKASRLIWIGFAMFVVGSGTYAWAIMRFAGQVDSLPINEPDVFHPPSLFGPQVAGIPIGLIGFALAGIGSLLLVVGIVLHVVAASRRRRLETQFPAPWQVVPPVPWHG
jgi:pSer/pThr/pTyr-binding forkhead associated (FHA) protein